MSKIYFRPNQKDYRKIQTLSILRFDLFPLNAHLFTQRSFFFALSVSHNNSFCFKNTLLMLVSHVFLLSNSDSTILIAIPKKDSKRL